MKYDKNAKLLQDLNRRKKNKKRNELIEKDNESKDSIYRIDVLEKMIFDIERYRKEHDNK